MSRLVSICGTSNPSRRGDVVFVHGLNGDAYATWQPDGQRDRFWPEWLCKDLPDIGVWSVGYEANSFGWKGSTMPLSDRAKNALVMLETDEVGTEKPVVFITHSLGGLLVKEMLRKATDGSVPEGEKLASHTRGVVFLSTPHSGSNLANFMGYLKFLLPSVSVDELKTQEPRLRELNTWYRNNVQKLGIETQVYCESKPTSSGKNFVGQLVSTVVVDATSSDPGIPGVTAVSMDDDHISISRPERDSTLYKRIRQLVSRCFKDDAASAQGTSASSLSVPSTFAPGSGSVAIGKDVADSVIVTGSGNVIYADGVPPKAQDQTGEPVETDLPALLNMLNNLVPTQLGILILILRVPPAVLPGSSAPHGDRVNALIAWAQSPGGAGLAKVHRELEKIIHPQ